MIHCPYCHAPAPAIYADGAFFSATCCEMMEQESDARDDLVPFEWISIVQTTEQATLNWQKVCQALGGVA